MVELTSLFQPQPRQLHVNLSFISQFLLEFFALDLEVRVHKHASFYVVRQRRRYLLLDSALGLTLSVFSDRGNRIYFLQPLLVLDIGHLADRAHWQRSSERVAALAADRHSNVGDVDR